MTKMTKTQINIVFSKSMWPTEIEVMMNEDAMLKELLPEKKVFLRFFDNRELIGDHTKPHGYITNITRNYEERRWIADVLIPSPYDPYFKLFKHPVIHPLCLQNINEEGSITYRIGYFRLFDTNELVMDHVYNGIRMEEF